MTLHDGEVPQDAGQGGFGAAAVRPRLHRSYARSAVGALADLLGRRLGDLRVLEVAAGSGVLTGQLVRGGVELIAAEADPGLRGQLVRSLPGVRVLCSAPHRLSLASGSLQHVVVSDPARLADELFLGEIVRVLAPAGALSLIAESDPSTATAIRMPMVGLESAGSSLHPYVDASGTSRRTELRLWRRAT